LYYRNKDRKRRTKTVRNWWIEQKDKEKGDTEIDTDTQIEKET